MNKSVKILIKKQFIWNFPKTHLTSNYCLDWINNLNEDLYKAVQTQPGYQNSQSYWDLQNNSLLFTDSYWNNIDCWKEWENSDSRNEILKKYKSSFTINTSSHSLKTKIDRYDVPLL
jgi:heme-degrading monooxygenase HmoA